MTPIFYIKDGNLSFADKNVLSNLELYVYPGDKICLVGRNGCGKSSLLKLITGEYELDSGSLFQAPSISIGYLKQDMKIVPTSTIYDFILKSFTEPENSKFQADIILKKLELDGNSLLSKCSGGQVRRTFLAHSLINEPDILLLDEPTNHLDIKAIEWLEEYVKSYQGAIICISHDRAFQKNVTNKVWWIDRGILQKSKKGFKYYDQWSEEVIAEEEAILRKMNRKLEAEKGWLNTGVTARRKRNQKRLANLHRLRETLREHQNKLESAKAKLHIELTEEVKKTQFIIEAVDISFSYYNKNILNNFNFKVKKGEKVGIIGPNGSGKSTLIKVLLKEHEPDSGKIKHGTNLNITYFDQHRTELNPNHTLQQTLCSSGGDQVFLKNNTMHIASYLKNFMFDPKLLNTKVVNLSGGEANRLLLVKALINPGNFLVLDEPTNDLDMDSLEMLLEMLTDYEGTLLIVSHDRDFLEKLVTRTLVFTKNSVIDLYGGYEDYLKYYKKDINGNKSKKEKAHIIVSSDRTGAKTGNSHNIDNRQKTSNIMTESSLLITDTIKTPIRSGKLSYKYQRLLEVLPQVIEKLETQIAICEKGLMDPNLYNNNPKKFNELAKQLEEQKASIEKKMQQWLEIESMK